MSFCFEHNLLLLALVKKFFYLKHIGVCDYALDVCKRLHAFLHIRIVVI